jgi:hypothetical protein
MQPIETALMGRIVAGLTHEMKNVLAIVKEGSGLMEDLLESAKPRDEAFEERLRKALSGIRKQVGRGIELSDGLNRFAHTLDGPETLLPPNDVARLVVFLMRRSARSSQIDLALRENCAAVSRGPVPSRFLLAACACLEQLLKGMSSGGTLEIHPEETEGGVALRISAKGEQPRDVPPGGSMSAPPGWDRLLSEVGVMLAPPLEGEAGGFRISVGQRD